MMTVIATLPAPPAIAPCPNRTVFFVSDGTGITAETFGNSILAQFAAEPRHVRLPFIDTVDKAHQVARRDRRRRPIAKASARSCSSTLVPRRVRDMLPRQWPRAAEAWCWTCSAPSSIRWSWSSASRATTAWAASPT
jgi:hypothetical protein